MNKTNDRTEGYTRPF